jgi:hypothetical protein
MFWKPKTVTLYRVVGQREMDLIRESGHRAFPPRTRDQPCFVAAPGEDYAKTIARDWSTKDAPLGTARYVTRFQVDGALLQQFSLLRVSWSAYFDRFTWQAEYVRSGRRPYSGPSAQDECWIPAGSMAEVNARLAGEIEVVADFPASPVWCLAANVRERRPYGEGGRETRRGTKHFPPGSKVCCFPPLWGDGYESVKVVGRHRGSHRYATMIIEARWLTNWRADLVYSPYVISELAPYWDGTAGSRQTAEQLAEGKRRRAENSGDSSPATEDR